VVHVLNRKVMNIGRTPEADLQIRASHISRQHARLLVGPAAVILEDLGSTNGCFVNGRRVKKQLLQNEDVLMIGKTRFRFTARPVADAPAH
jgi:pSer/pThr/pTyr-binding forkhead associated (FHA) protein